MAFYSTWILFSTWPSLRRGRETIPEPCHRPLFWRRRRPKRNVSHRIEQPAKSGEVLDSHLVLDAVLDQGWVEICFFFYVHTASWRGKRYTMSPEDPQGKNGLIWTMKAFSPKLLSFLMSWHLKLNSKKSFCLFVFLNCIDLLFVNLCVYMHACHGKYMEIRGQPMNFVFSHIWVWWLMSSALVAGAYPFSHRTGPG